MHSQFQTVVVTTQANAKRCQTSQGGIHNDAGDGKSQALVGAAANAAGMALMMSFCTGPDLSKTSCVLAAMAGATIPIMLQGASDSGNTQSASFGNGYSGFDDPNFDPSTGDVGGLSTPTVPGLPAGLDPNTPVPGPYGTVGGLQRAVNDINGQLNDLGYSADVGAQAVETPNGPVSFSEANSAAAGGGGSGGGLPPALKSQLAALSKDYEKIADKYNVVSSKFNSAGGGGGRSGKSFKFNSGKDPFADYLKSLRKGKRKPASVKGLQKIVDGTAIGVGGDDIFDMVHRKYQSKRGQRQFFERTFKRHRSR